jgi:hypothetical protein
MVVIGIIGVMSIVMVVVVLGGDDGAGGEDEQVDEHGRWTSKGKELIFSSVY